jgi:hypothetical protein
MISHFAFGILFIIFYAFKFAYRVSTGTLYRPGELFQPALNLFRDLSSRSGGRLYQPGRHQLRYYSNDQDLQIDFRLYSRPRLEIRLYQPSTFRFSATRIPRLIFAFLEAYFPAQFQLNGLPYFVVASSPEFLSDLKSRTGFLQLFEQLNNARFSIRLNSSGLYLRKTLKRSDLDSATLQGYIELARDIARICDQSYLEIPIHSVESQMRCAYCKELILENVPVTYCSACNTPHHPECFQLNGRCAVFGCNSNRHVEPPIPLAM